MPAVLSGGVTNSLAIFYSTFLLRRLKRGPAPEPRPTPKKCAHHHHQYQNSRESNSDGMNGRRPPGGRVNDDGGDGDAADGEA